MMITIYFVLNAIEAFLASAYMALVGSESDSSFLFNLSLSRLFVVIVICLVAFLFVYLTVKSWLPQSNLKQKIEKHLQDEKILWRLFAAGIILAAAMLFLLTRQTNQFGDYKLIYQRFEPVIVWLAILGAQSAFFAALVYCACFVKTDHQPDFSKNMAELPALFGLYVVFVLVKLLFVTSTAYGPLGRGDEMTYFDMADSLYRGFFSVASSHHYPPLYPLSFVPALVFKGYTFAGIKLLNVLYSSSIIFPVYFLTRKFLDHKHSLIAAFLSCLIPYHLVFPRRILSENLFFPLFVWAFYVTFVVSRNRRMRLRWDILTGVMIAVLYLTRYITLAAIPFFMLAWWVKPFEGEVSLFKPGWKKISHFTLLVIAMLAAYSPWLIAGLKEDVPLKLILGFTIASRTNPEQLTLPRLLIWIVLYACYYVLVAAPVLNLLLASFTQVDFKKWREGFGRLVFQVLALMAGFYVAVARHSWRAYYNLEMPTTIMGRYLIVFSVFYFVIAVVFMAKFDRKQIKSPIKFVLWTNVLPFLMIVFSNSALIQGVIFETDGNLFKALGSVDGFLTEILGPWFFLLVGLLYSLETVLFLREKKKYFIPVLVGGLLVYYLLGVPSYYSDLMDYQTYPWLAQQISKLLPPPDLKSADAEKVTVFLPDDHESKDEAEIYNGLRVRGINGTEVLTETEDSLEQMRTDRGFIIQKLESAQDPQSGQKVYEFNGEYFLLQEVHR